MKRKRLGVALTGGSYEHWTSLRGNRREMRPTHVNRNPTNIIRIVLFHFSVEFFLNLETRSRQCSRILGDEEGGDETDRGEEGFRQLVVAGGEAAKLFELVEEAFDAVAAAIEFLVVGELFGAAADRGDDGLDAVERETLPDAIGVVAFVEGANSSTLSTSRLS